MDSQEKYIAVISKKHEPIMIGSKNNQILDKLKEHKGVKVLSIEKWIESLNDISLSQEKIHEISEKVESLLLLDELESVGEEVLMEAYNKKKEKSANEKALIVQKLSQLKASGYDVNESGTVTIAKTKLGRNSFCACGKKVKKCQAKLGNNGCAQKMAGFVF